MTRAQYRTKRLRSKRLHKRVLIGVVAALLACIGAVRAESRGANGEAGGQNPERFVLGPHPSYPRLFRDPSGGPLLLIGNYSWGVFSNADYDYVAMLDTLKSNGLNFARVWLFWGDPFDPDIDLHTGEPIQNIVPYLRTGPGLANDGRPRYDLNRFNPEFFTRLRRLCAAAQERGIYLQLCIFDGWILKTPRWRNHVYQRDNNINGVDGDPNHSGRGRDSDKGFASLNNPKVMRYQQALVRKVVDTVNDFDHILFEIANENINRQWELAMCDYLHEYEKTKPKRHQVMPMDIPNHWEVVQRWDTQAVRLGFLKRYDLRRPMIFDTDWTLNNNDDEIRRAMWSAVLTGAHFNYLDASFQPGSSHGGDSRGYRRAALRRQIGILAAFTRQIRFWEMAPADGVVDNGNISVLASSKEMAAYLPFGGTVTLDMQNLKSTREAYWYNPRNGVWRAVDDFTPGYAQQAFTAPDGNDWLLYIRSGTDKVPPGVPVNIQATAQTAALVDLSWTPPSDDVGVAGYRVFRNGEPAGTTATPGFIDSHVKPQTGYVYSVVAYDMSGNRSARSTLSPQVLTPSQQTSFTIRLGDPNVPVRLFHVPSRDGQTEAVTTDGTPCRRPVDPRSKYFYFSIDDRYLFNTGGTTAYLKVTYFDDTGFVEPQFDAMENRYASGKRIPLTGSQTWKSAVWKLTNCKFANRQNSGADFRIHVGPNAVRIKAVELSLLPFADTD
jgi:Putative collagen-binding domain of a collagenase/Family of unknown function (DUF6298)